MDLELLAARDDGFEEGMERGLDKGINALIETCRELGASDSIIVEKIVEKYKIPYDKASEYLKEM